MRATQDFGTPPVPKKQMSDSSKETIVGYVLSALVAIVIVLGIMTPIAFYVIRVVPAQQKQMHDLRVVCLEHHTVEACMSIGGRPQ